MKSLIRSFVFNIFALQLAVSFIPGVSYRGGLRTLGLAAIALAAFNLLVKPIINLLFLPLNLLTLGMFRWVVNVIILYLLTITVPQFKIYGFDFPGFSYQNFSLSSVFINSFWTTVLTSFFLSFVLSFLDWLK